MFRKIDKTSTFNDVLKQIIEKIQTGELQPGDALPAERILAEEFGISRPALREVLKKKLTVADTERLIKKEPKPKKKKASADVKKTISRNVKIALNTLQQAIGMIEKTGTSLQQETEDLEDEYVITIRIHK